MFTKDVVIKFTHRIRIKNQVSQAEVNSTMVSQLVRWPCRNNFLHISSQKSLALAAYLLTTTNNRQYKIHIRNILTFSWKNKAVELIPICKFCLKANLSSTLMVLFLLTFPCKVYKLWYKVSFTILNINFLSWCNLKRKPQSEETEPLLSNFQ